MQSENHCGCTCCIEQVWPSYTHLPYDVGGYQQPMEQYSPHVSDMQSWSISPTSWQESFTIDQQILANLEMLSQAQLHRDITTSDRPIALTNSLNLSSQIAMYAPSMYTSLSDYDSLTSTPSTSSLVGSLGSPIVLSNSFNQQQGHVRTTTSSSTLDGYFQSPIKTTQQDQTSKISKQTDENVSVEIVKSIKTEKSKSQLPSQTTSRNTSRVEQNRMKSRRYGMKRRMQRTILKDMLESFEKSLNDLNSRGLLDQDLLQILDDIAMIHMTRLSDGDSGLRRALRTAKERKSIHKAGQRKVEVLTMQLIGDVARKTTDLMELSHDHYLDTQMTKFKQDTVSLDRLLYTWHQQKDVWSELIEAEGRLSSTTNTNCPVSKLIRSLTK
jgi:hypothetical protein